MVILSQYLHYKPSCDNLSFHNPKALYGIQYWILNAIDNCEDEECEDKELAIIELAQLVFKTNYYSQKLTSETENIDAKKDLATSLYSLDISIDTIAKQMMSMDTPKYARLELDQEEAIKKITVFP